MGYLILIKPSSRCSPDAWMRFVGLRGMNLLGSRGSTPGGIQRIADARAERAPVRPCFLGGTRKGTGLAGYRCLAFSLAPFH